jgi:lipopolysaccharide biosynthesis glycosyltransferase
MEGLGASLTSLIRNCSNTEKLKIWILCDQLSQNDKDNIKQLLIFEDFKGISEFIDVNTENEFRHLKAYHGNKAAYGRFLIPSIF